MKSSHRYMLLYHILSIYVYADSIRSVFSDTNLAQPGEGVPAHKLAQRDSNPRVQESKSCALPLGDGPLSRPTDTLLNALL